MNKFLITGFSGFVSKHFVAYLEKNKIPAAVLGVDYSDTEIEKDNYKYVGMNFKKLNLFEKESLESVINEFQPDYILHLASFSSVASSWQDPVFSFQNNTNIFLNLVDAVRSQKINTRVLSVGSSEEYGDISPDDVPLKEDHQLYPVSPYAVARVSQELISKVYASGFKLNIIMTRSFNHVGPGQKDMFVISSFAKQLCQIKLNGGKGNIVAGDVSIIRDFLDVRDVVDAYYKLLVNGKVGEVYNVCSGIGITLREAIKIMCEILDIDVEIRVDKKLIRPADNNIIIGSNEKIKNELKWKPEHTIRESLTDVINYWMKELTK